MDHRASGFASVLERLTAKLEDLERRISALEKGTARQHSVETLRKSPVVEARHSEVPVPSPSVSLISILGKSVLGIAGAYLLRAAAETEVFPKLAVVIVALLYAWLWQYLSVRAGKNSQAVGAAYGITSALILFPMLWEITVGFKILPPNITAMVLVVSMISALVLGWRGKASATVWATAVFSSFTALGLLVVTRDPLPFTLALVSTSALAEFTADREGITGLRFAIAVPLNLALLSLLYLATRPGGFPSEYEGISHSVLIALFVAAAIIFAVGAVVRSSKPQRSISFLEVAQTFVAVGLLCMAVVYLGGAVEEKLFGVCCLVLGACSYHAAFFSARIRDDSLKFQIYATWAGALLLMGSVLAIPPGWLAPWLNLGAVLAIVFSALSRQLTLGLHGFSFLLVAQISAGFPVYATQLLVGNIPAAPPSMVWWAAIGAIGCSLILLLRDGDIQGIRILRFCYFSNAALVFTAFLVFVSLTILQTGNDASPSRLALIRSITICVVTLAMAVLGAVRSREELVWVAYSMIGLGTLKLVFEDLRLGSTGSFALSLVAYGVVLALIPQIVRTKNQKPGQA